MEREGQFNRQADERKNDVWIDRIAKKKKGRKKRR